MCFIKFRCIQKIFKLYYNLHRVARNGVLKPNYSSLVSKFTSVWLQTIYHFQIAKFCVDMPPFFYKRTSDLRLLTRSVAGATHNQFVSQIAKTAVRAAIVPVF